MPFTRRTFVKSGSFVAGAAMAGCRTAETTTGAEEAEILAPSSKDIVRCEIHPTIGVARVGNSKAEDGYVVGPETTTPPPAQAAQLRDETGALKRQAARFRIYGYDADNRLVGEVTAEKADIKWTVHLANKKAAHYRCTAPLDIAETAKAALPRRNAAVKGAARAGLVIDPGPRTIGGKAAKGPQFQFTGGKFMGVGVPLGELRTDEHGRLLVLGGAGNSASPKGTPLFNDKDPDSFNNADGWFDDTSDGPVTAVVTIAGKAVPVDGAWVVVAPPNFAPDVVAWRTLHDALTDAYIESGLLPQPETTSFTKHILPCLSRLAGLQWVNAGYAQGFGRGGTARDFDDPALLKRLAAPPPKGNKTDPNAELRQEVFVSFRIVGDKADEKAWPWLYGDAFGAVAKSPRLELIVSDTRAKHLQRWAAGKFISDWNPTATPPQSLDDVPVTQQPAMLDEASLTFCVADAFHPGCELGWPLRHASLFSAPYRIKDAGPQAPNYDYGDKLTAAQAMAANGPLGAQGPGDLTRWMALPWQGDTAMCRSGYADPHASGYDPDFDPYLPTFWPARVPNHVLSAADYELVVSSSLSRAERLKAFKTRVSWTRGLTGGPVEQMQQVVANFASLGLIETRPGVDDDIDFPPEILVEALPPGANLAVSDDAARAQATSKDPLVRAGWMTKEQLKAFRKIRRLK